MRPQDAMYKFILPVILCLILFSTSCVVHNECPPTPTPICKPIPEPPKYSSLLWLARECDDGLGAIYITPCQVSMSGFTEGNNTASHPITIFNGADTAEFSVFYSSNPEGLGCRGCPEDYVLAPDQAKNWIDISAKSPVIQSGKSRDVDITVEIPDGQTTPHKWAFWIIVEHEPTGTLFPSLWLIEMKQA